MSIYILLALLFILLFVSYIFFDKDIFSPSCLFCIAFILSVSNLIMNLEYWAVNFKLKTAIVIIVGVGSFILGAGLLSELKTVKHGTNTSIRYIETKKRTLVLWLLFECVVLALVIRYLINYTGANIFNAITIFRQASFTDAPIKYPSWLSLCYFVCRRSAYVWAYIIVNNYFLDEKVDLTILFCFLVSADYPFFVGERGSIVELLHWSNSC